MSSPNGKRGHFYENWQHAVGVERIKIIGRECPRIGVPRKDAPEARPAAVRAGIREGKCDDRHSLFDGRFFSLSTISEVSRLGLVYERRIRFYRRPIPY